MPVNGYSHAIIHRGQGNRLIMPGQWYEGPEIGADGDYLHLQPQVEGALASEGVDPKEGAPADGGPADERGAPAQDLEEMTNAELKALAESKGIKVTGRPNKDELIALIQGAAEPPE